MFNTNIDNIDDIDDIIKGVFSKVYPRDGFDTVNNMYKGLKVDRNLAVNKNLPITKKILDDQLNPTSMLTSFFGFPNRYPDDLLRSYLGWESEVSTAKMVFNIIKMPFRVFITNPLRIIFTTAKNTLKLFTEFLPALAFAFLNEARKSFIENKIITNKPAYIALSVPYYFFRAIHFVGRALTSPLVGIESAYKNGESVAGNNKTLGKVLGTVLAGVSGLITIAAYTFILPIAFKALAVYVLPPVLNVLPTQIANVAAAIVNVLTPHLTVVGNVIHATSASIFNAITITPAYTALAVVASAVITTMGQGVSLLTDWVKHKWHQPEPKAQIEADSVVSEPKKQERPGCTYALIKLLSDLFNIRDAQNNLAAQPRDLKGKAAVPNKHNEITDNKSKSSQSASPDNTVGFAPVSPRRLSP